jgi:hypothetical protein
MPDELNGSLRESSPEGQYGYEHPKTPFPATGIGCRCGAGFDTNCGGADLSDAADHFPPIGETVSMEPAEGLFADRRPIDNCHPPNR